jgi:nucleoside-diphosphate-sugar epimerase
MSLVVFGYGYTSQHFVRMQGAHYAPVLATVRSPERAAKLTITNCDVVTFGETIDPSIGPAIDQASYLLISAPPDENGDPVLAKFEERIAQSKIERVVYLSTVGVYGDHGGAWIDESTPCDPSNARSRWRLAAEEAWLALGARMGKPAHVLRLSGIYGPGRNALANLRAGTARRIIKSGQVFNRIHVEDIARAIAACFDGSLPGSIWNVTDDEPAAPQDVVAGAAALLGMEPPPEIPFEEAQLSPMARSFYGECKRVSNRAMRQELGVTLAFPTWREALRALHESGEGR